MQLICYDNLKHFSTFWAIEHELRNLLFEIGKLEDLLFEGEKQSTYTGHQNTFRALPLKLCLIV